MLISRILFKEQYKEYLELSEEVLLIENQISISEVLISLKK